MTITIWFLCWYKTRYTKKWFYACGIFIRFTKKQNNICCIINLIWFAVQINIWSIFCLNCVQCRNYYVIYQGNKSFVITPLMSLFVPNTSIVEWKFRLQLRPQRTQDSGQVYSTQNYTRKYYIRITLQNNTSMLNKYGPDIIKNAEMHVGRPLRRS